jgi:hypothetical protein
MSFLTQNVTTLYLLLHFFLVASFYKSQKKVISFNHRPIHRAWLFRHDANVQWELNTEVIQNVRNPKFWSCTCLTTCVQHWLEKVQNKKKAGNRWLAYDTITTFVTEKQGERPLLLQYPPMKDQLPESIKLEFRCRVRYLQATVLDTICGHCLKSPLQREGVPLSEYNPHCKNTCVSFYIVILSLFFA